MAGKTIRIGGASGYQGDSPSATPQLLKAGGVQYLVYDFLAELNVPILARQRAANPDAGYVRDFIDTTLRPNLIEVARQGVKMIANAGGLNPPACGEAARELIRELGLNLKVAVITGDDVVARKDEFFAKRHKEMFSGAAFPTPDKVIGANAYLGAFPIAKALKMGADIIITGRIVDSAAALAACIYEFGWTPEDVDKLSAGSLAGHLIECGTQVTGGNFTDWELAADTYDRLGYPIVEVSEDGELLLTKPEGTGGIVNVGMVSEQMIYEISDPQAYMLPDVIADFSRVELSQEGENRVRLRNAKGAPAPDTYKTCVTYTDGFRSGMMLTLYGADAEKKANALAKALFKRCTSVFHARNMPDFTETSVEVLGTEAHYGASRRVEASRELVLKLSVKHASAEGAAALLREFVGMALATPPGFCSATQTGPDPLLCVYSFLLPKKDVAISIDFDGKQIAFVDASGHAFNPASLKRPTPPAKPAMDGKLVDVPLIKLAYGRSGDKGNKINVAVIARNPAYLPYIWNALSEDVVTRHYAHFLESGVERYLLPGSNAINFLLNDVLAGGGTSSLRQDSLGKGFGQLMLALSIPLPQSFAEQHGLLSQSMAAQ